MKALFCRATGLEESQVIPAGLATLYIFFVLAGYYIAKPLRDDIALLLGKEFIPKLFVWTLLVMVVANPVFSALMNRVSRVRFIKYVYRFFALNLLGFIAAFKWLEDAGMMPEGGEAVQVHGAAFTIGAVFFVWVSVFNLFAVSIFWALMADLFDSGSSKKLFGLVGAGGTVGQLVGSGATTALVDKLGPTNLLFLTVITLELAVYAMMGLTSDHVEPTRETGPSKPNAFSGITDILKSPYLLGICLYLFLYTFTSTFLYFQKQHIVDVTLSDREERVAFFATVSLLISVFTLIIQVFLTGRLLPMLGLSVGLSMVPIVTVIGFVALGFNPGLWPLAAVEVCRSTANYGISRPSREVLFTVVSRREKYLSKSFIDTFVYRAGDAIASGAFAFIQGLSLSLQAISFVAVPVAFVYLGVAGFLGQAQARRAASQAEN
ncbi:MAG: MFS transporter [Candidatus Eremiobacteraeota bacterium]|nr:MFS transporter [Candidatus Eremiobacteraeota bacterium]